MCGLGWSEREYKCYACILFSRTRRNFSALLYNSVKTKKGGDFCVFGTWCR